MTKFAKFYTWEVQPFKTRTVKSRIILQHAKIYLKVVKRKARRKFYKQWKLELIKF